MAAQHTSFCLVCCQEPCMCIGATYELRQTGFFDTSFQDTTINPALLKAPEPYERFTTSAQSFTSNATTLKRPSCDYQGSDADAIRNETKRQKNAGSRARAERTDKGYHCTYPGCEKRFDLHSEAKKHFKGAHTPFQLKPHRCLQTDCNFRGMWQKDVRRHLKQKHGITIAANEEPLPSLPLLDATTKIEPPNARVSHDGELAMSPQEMTTQHDAYANIPVPTNASNPTAPHTPRKKKMSFSALQSVVMMLQKLKVSKDTDDESEQSKCVLVTDDQKIWRKIHLDGVNSADGMIRKIVAEFPHQASSPNDILLHRLRSSGGTGERLSPKNIMHVVSKAARGKKTLEIALTTVHSRTRSVSGHAAEQPRVDRYTSLAA